MKRRLSEHRAAPLSFEQHRFLTFNQRQWNPTVERQAMAFRLIGSIDISAVKKAITAIVDQHQILRTTRRLSGGHGPVEVVCENRPLFLPILGMSNAEDNQRTGIIEHGISALMAGRLDSLHDRLLRDAILRPNPAEYVVLPGIHSIAADDWTREILSREPAMLCNACLGGHLSPLPDLPIQYSDYASSQRQWIKRKAAQGQLSYWKTQLNGILPLPLPSIPPRRAIPRYGAAILSSIRPKFLGDPLITLSRREDPTFFMMLLAALQTLLSRYTAQKDIFVAFQVSGRNTPETKAFIGFFENTVVLRADLAGDLIFRTLLDQIRRTTITAYKHQDFPFEELVQELYPDSDSIRIPLFQVGFAHQALSRMPLELPGLTALPVELKTTTAKVDLTLNVLENSDGLKTTWECNTDIFDRSTVERMIGHLQKLLVGIVANPDHYRSQLPPMIERETHQPLVSKSNIQGECLKEMCVHEMFEALAEKNPDATAVMCVSPTPGNDTGNRLTYRDLNDKANQLSHYLRKLGARPEIPVGLYIDRSPEMIIGLLAIHKAGGAYVLLDPNDPLERLLGILEEIQFPIILSQQRLAKTLPDHLGKVICLDTDWETIARESQSNPVAQATPENLAYVNYTSGATGRPIGVEITHTSLTNFVRWAATAYELTPSDRLLQFASISFDTAVEKIFSCLANGATLVLSTATMFDSSPKFLGCCREWQVTVLDLPIANWHEWVDKIATPRTDFGHLRLVITGGEQASGNHMVRWRKAIGDRVRLVNTYGPSEATGVTTLWDTSENLNHHQVLGEVFIGRPISNVQVYILDEHLTPVPIGVRGEIYIGGVGLARGYFKSPGLTGEYFIPNPFSLNLSDRLYKTGDFACYRADGNIEFLGRVDNQIKLNGFTVKLAEIEAILSQHPFVRNSVVLARDDRSGYKRLVAYIEPSKGTSPTASSLASSLRATLPKCMVPVKFTFLNHLPLTPSGKIDRQALAIIEEKSPEFKDSFIVPRTADEKMIARIWAEILDLEQIGIDDNFFDLSNQSTSAIQLINEVRKVFAVDLSVRALFEVPTVAGMAAAIAQGKYHSPYSRDLVVLSPDTELSPHAEAQSFLYKH